MAGRNAIETHGVNKNFGGVVAARNVDLFIREGEIRCMIGPNGAGKSTLFSMLCGIQPPDSGKIRIFGQNVASMHAFQRVGLGVGLTFQTNRVFRSLSVQENLAIPLASRGHEHGAEGKGRLEFALEAFGFDTHDPTPASELPHNRLQWLEITMVLTGYPRLVLLDEPTAGMAGEETQKTAEVLKHLNETGLTIVAVEHDMSFVREIAETVTVLHQGEIFAEGTVDEITSHDDVRRIYLGRA